MGNGPLITVVDDDPSVRKALGRLLRSVGYAVQVFGSAEEFEADAEATACLVLDVHLPGRNGLELQAELQARQQDVPVVFITAFEDPAARAQALAAGAREFLRKPVDGDRLVSVIEKIVTGG